MSLDLERQAARWRAGQDQLVRDLEAEAVPAATVPIGIRVAAEEALERASAELGLMLPRVVWINSETMTGAGCDGSTPRGRADVIYVSADLSPDRVRFVIRHEVRHCHQNRTGRHLNEAEADANRFAWG